MRTITAFLVLLLVNTHLHAEERNELAYKLKASVVKVHVGTKGGGHGVGTGVAISEDLIVTNCHVVANSTGTSITNNGKHFQPVGLKADWEHDLCILRFEYANLKPVQLGSSEGLQYEQDIFSIGFPGGVPKPMYTEGKVKALYTLDDSKVVRTSAAFWLGASGSPVFNTAGELVAISTFKSPGRKAYYYNMPVEWVKALLQQPDTETTETDKLPFWDAPEEKRPFFMRVVQPFKNSDWDRLNNVAQLWIKSEPDSPEAFYYAGIAEEKIGSPEKAKQYFNKALTLQPEHPAAIAGLSCTEKVTLACNNSF